MMSPANAAPTDATVSPDSAEGAAAGEFADHWLDDLTEPAEPAFDKATHRALTWFAIPARLARRIFSFGGTTPGKLTAMMLLLTMAIAAAGASMAVTSSDRHHRLNVLLSSTEPMNNAAHNLYTSLSLADTLATTDFARAGGGGVGTGAARKQYNEAIDKATVAASEAMLGTTQEDERIRELAVLVQRKLPVYTALVESGRANHRVGNTVGVNYVTNASAMLRDEILPAAGELFQLTSAKVAQQQRELTTPQWVPISGFMAAIIFLVAAQWWLWRLTRRRLNRGFVTATFLLFLALTWVITANALTWAAGAQRFEVAATPWEQLTNSQIAAQQARTTETLAILNRQATHTAHADFAAMEASVNGALDAYDQAAHIGGEKRATLTAARAAITDWSDAHNVLTTALANGDHDEAVRQATEVSSRAGQPTAASAFTELDLSLSRLIADTRATMRGYIAESLDATRALGDAMAILTGLAILSIWMGIRPRLQEYM